MKDNIIREITPLKETDCLWICNRVKNDFDFPLHYHPEFELNLILNAPGAKRMVGDHQDSILDAELVLIGPNLYHCWENGAIDKQKSIREITIQFPVDLFGDGLLRKDTFKPIRDMLQNADRGISFAQDTAKRYTDRIIALTKLKGFESFVELQSLLFDLARSKDQQFLTNISFLHESDKDSSKHIDKVYRFIKSNYDKKLKVEDAATLLNMSVVSFSRLIKQRTGRSFIDFVNEVRLGYATRMLIDTNKSVAEICFDCGFNNLSNFNRIFKKKQGVTPTDFRCSFTGSLNDH